MSTLGFITQRELDCVVGSPRRRQRLVSGGVLPSGRHVKTFGKETIIFPEFAIAGLVVDRRTAQDEPLLEELRVRTELLYDEESFATISEVVRRVLREQRPRGLSDLAAALVEHADAALRTWRQQVEDSKRELAEAGILVTIRLGQIETVLKTGYRVAMVDGERVSVPINAAQTSLSAGAWVARETVELGARKGELLMPSVAPSVLTGLGENPAATERGGEDLDDMFSAIDFEPVVVPVLRQTLDDESDSRGDLVRPVRRIRIRANRDIYANAEATTMALPSHRPLAAH